ncbi:polyadenylate-binding protein 6-like [Pyrus ussuriensis x Pyrus communis]|uniref:Polyadenylate-binding protein 6-like n=1 Tax=Pyrus ussuriensis x Pyrus communis TaxID=2448454 RepID=A0A5N5H882_9ROSA|nr:polyadenylate-binding protein 6-like [Pyrus ussuriensis x Pyrus communis]
MASSTTSKTQMPLPPPPTLPPLPPPPPPADHRTGVEVAVHLCRDAQGYHLPRKTGSGNASVKNSINSTHLQRFCNALEKKGKTKGFDESSVTTINALNDTIVNRKKLVLPVDTLLMVPIMLYLVVQDTPYDYDNPGAGGGGGGYLLDTVVGNALALVPVPVPAPSHQVEDGGAIILVVGDGDGGGGPGAGGGVLPIDRVLSVYRIMLGWQNPFNFIPRFQFSLNLDIVRGDGIRACHGSHMVAVLRER